MTTTKRGIEHTKKLLATVFKAGNALSGVMNWLQLLFLFPALLDVVRACSNIHEVKREIDDLEPDEVTQLTAYFNKEFDLPFDRAEKVVERGFETILQIASTLTEIRRMKDESAHA